MELSMEKLEALYKKFGREYSPGSVVFMEESCGDEMYIILDGEVEVTKTYREFEYDKKAKLFTGTNTQTLGILKRGDFFGEMALLNDSPRSATARVLIKTKLICIGRDNFNLVIGSANPLVLQILKSLSARLREANRYPRMLPRAQAAAEPAKPAGPKRDVKANPKPAPKPESAVADVPKPAAAPAVKTTLQSRSCSQCGARVERDAKYCRECGTRVPLT